ncbi:hypothetical protein [Lewinella sp. LCG006]|uniref:hypothetical protein n=1 Tax=Lewinella sp. LCG006 TaxID=3231911 RepID=UPI0034615F55
MAVRYSVEKKVRPKILSINPLPKKDELPVSQTLHRRLAAGRSASGYHRPGGATDLSVGLQHPAGCLPLAQAAFAGLYYQPDLARYWASRAWAV